MLIDWIPDTLKQQIVDSVVEFIGRQAENLLGEQIGEKIRSLSWKSELRKSLNDAIRRAITRFEAEYIEIDEDLTFALLKVPNFWNEPAIQQAILNMVLHPGIARPLDRAAIVAHFGSVLPQRRNRERVDRAVVYLLRTVAEEIWTVPGASEVKQLYSLQMQKMSNELAQQQVELLRSNLQATAQLNTDLRQALLQLTEGVEQRLLSSINIPVDLPRPRPYHNLAQPEYTHFIGRESELNWLRQRLSSTDRAWQIVITGIGGVGKSAIAQAIAHEYRQNYDQIPIEERFEAIVWISAKEYVLTAYGKEESGLTGLTFQTLEDIYTTIAQTLEHEDITRALPEEQSRLVQKALVEQRTLLIIDNFETVSDKRVRSFLRSLPTPTKAIITSRNWLDVADVLTLTGLPALEAGRMIMEEATVRNIQITTAQRDRIVERTAGLPLPIKLSISRIASGESFDAVIRWLGDYATGELPVYCIKGQTDLVQKVNPSAWITLLSCTLFDQNIGATREALGYVTDLSLSDRDDGLACLQRFSLINHTTEDRFWLLPIVQGYINAQFSLQESNNLLEDRWLNWLLEFTKNYGGDLDLNVERVHKFGLEYANVYRGIRWCHERQAWHMLQQLVDQTLLYPSLIGLFNDLREMLAAGIYAARNTDNEQNEGKFTRFLAWIASVQGSLNEAISYLNKAESIARKYNDLTELIELWSIKSSVLSDLGHLTQAEKLMKAGLKIGMQTRDLKSKALAATRLGEIAAKQEQFDEALKWLDFAANLAKELGWTRGEARVLHRRGSCLLQQGRFYEAENFLIQALTLSSSWGERRGAVINKYVLAQIYAATDRRELARQTAEEVHELCNRLGMLAQATKAENLLRELKEQDNLSQ